MRCKCVKDIVDEANRILFLENKALYGGNVEYFFRGESMNFKRKDEGVDLPLDTAFLCYLDWNQKFIDNEREFYQGAIRLNVASVVGKFKIYHILKSCYFLCMLWVKCKIGAKLSVLESQTRFLATNC